METAFQIHFDPLLPETWLMAAAIAALLLTGLSFYKAKSISALRIIVTAVFLLALFNPSLLEEEREPVKDIAVVVVDQSPSQDFGRRAQRTQAALDSVKAELETRDDLELRIVHAPQDKTLDSETRIFETLNTALSDIAPDRRAGVIVITDGQIHDVPAADHTLPEFGPVHALLTGDREEKDRQLVIVKSQAYGIVDQSVSLTYKVEDTNNIGRKTAQVTLNRHDGQPDVFMVPVGEEQTLELPIRHAGQNIFELSTAPVDGELTESNNRAAVIVNGVRDRLKVLLVSGRPHAGGRTWRDLLTSDPGVDLVHFTILREPNKLDATPQNELSLIAFPFRELFEIKLYDFDLIIFDRYKLNRILPSRYFNNIVRYVEEGGALLVSTGPDFATEDSLYYTALMNILPALPSGEIIRQPFKPAVTDQGIYHPVTYNLPGSSAASEATQPGWGHWLRQIVLTPETGDVLMKGAAEKPLLILDRVKEGRVAQLASDHIWLWSRGYEGGGPHGELLRRVIHWLMKEPELDEKALTVQTHKDSITVQSRNLQDGVMDITVEKPDGTQETLTLEKTGHGLLEGSVDAKQLGIWSFENPAGQRRFAIMGDMNPPELRGVKTTPDKLKPLMDNTKGGVFWLADSGVPDIRTTGNARKFAGANWLGLKKNDAYVVKGAKDRALLLPWLAAALLLGLTVLTWWIEGRKT